MEIDCGATFVASAATYNVIEIRLYKKNCKTLFCQYPSSSLINMKDLLFIIFLVGGPSDFVFAQTSANHTSEKNQFSLLVPIILNTTEVTYYITGNPRQTTSTAISYGLEMIYSRPIFNGFIFSAGVGYFKQRFNNERPFNYSYDSSLLLLSTKKYTYDNIKYLIGIGYSHKLKDVVLQESVSYHHLWSFRQKYIPSELTSLSYRNYEVKRDKYSFGKMITINANATKEIDGKFSIALGLIMPIYTKWRKDPIFWEDRDDYYHSKFSLGVSASIMYNF